MNPGPHTGLVVAAYGRRGVLQRPDDGARLPFLVPARGLRPCCGDVVRWRYGPEGDVAHVVAIEPRRNELQRQPARGTRPEVLAANLSHLLIVLAPEPEPDLFLADRFLCASALMGADAAIVVNKSDLGAPTGDVPVYARLGYPVLSVSSRTGEKLAAIHDWFGAGTGVLAGQSGVGKSSLLNALAPSAAAATQTLSDSTGEGRHTTTASELHQTPGGASLIDLPGVRDFVPALPEPRRIMTGFREIVQLADDCRFADCLHRHEPDCAVRTAVDSGAIDERRYESYRRLLNLADKASRLRD